MTWISIREKLPRVHEEVILCYADGTVLISCLFLTGFMFERIYGRVTHWMPVPAPPEA